MLSRVGTARVLAAALLLPFLHLAAADGTGSAEELVGLWKAQHDFGPDARGPLILQKTASGWWVDFRGRSIAVNEDDNVLTFELPNREGGFRARLQPDGTPAGGQWFQPASPANPPFGTGITFKSDGSKRWRGDVIPLEDTSTFYLMLQRRPDGSVGPFFRHREFNLGVRYLRQQLLEPARARNSAGLTPRRMLPAVREAGDAKDTSVVPREYKVTYGRKPRATPVAPPAPSPKTP
jgi:hypothetical protein